MLAHRPRNPRAATSDERRQMFSRGAAAGGGPQRNLVKVGQHSLKIKWMGRRNQFCESASVGNDELGIYSETGRADNRSGEIDH